MSGGVGFNQIIIKREFNICRQLDNTQVTQFDDKFCASCKRVCVIEFCLFCFFCNAEAVVSEKK